MAKKPIKVSQATIDRIKKMGMTAALKKAGTSNNAEYVEGIRRMYGARRLAAAKKAVAPKVAKSPDQARARAAKKAAASSMSKMSPRASERKTPVKKTTTSGYKPSAEFKAKQAMAARGRARLRGGIKLPQDVVKLGKPKLPKLSMGVKQYK